MRKLVLLLTITLTTFTTQGDILYTRSIWHDDESKSVVVPAHGPARLTSEQKMPIRIHPLDDNFHVMASFSSMSNLQYTVKPLTAGTIEIPNPLEPWDAYFIPSATWRGLCMVNVTADNTRQQEIIGQLHFEVKRIWK